MELRSKRSQHKDLPVPKRIPCGFNKHCPVVWDAACNQNLPGDMAEQVPRRGMVESACLADPINSVRRFKLLDDFSQDSPHRIAKFKRAPRALASPKWHDSQGSRRGHNPDSIRFDRFNAPDICPQQESVANATLENKFLVQFSDSGSFRRDGREVAGVRNRASPGESQVSGSRQRLKQVVNPIPNNSWLKRFKG